MNFGYVENGEKKNALVKIRVCEKCSYRLNYKTAQKRVASSRTTTRQEREKSRSPVRLSGDASNGPKTRDSRGSRYEAKHDRHGKDRSSSEKPVDETQESKEASSGDRYVRHGKDRRSRSRTDEQAVDKKAKDRDRRGTSEKSARRERKGRSDEFDAVFEGLFE